VTQTMTPLRQRMIDDMAIRNLAASTRKIYVLSVANFSAYHGRSPDQLTFEDVRDYQLLPCCSDQLVGAGSQTGQEVSPLAEPWMPPCRSRPRRLPSLHPQAAASLYPGGKHECNVATQSSFCVDNSLGFSWISNVCMVHVGRVGTASPDQVGLAPDIGDQLDAAVQSRKLDDCMGSSLFGMASWPWSATGPATTESFGIATSALLLAQLANTTFARSLRAS
jgi:hypothetical protein